MPRLPWGLIVYDLICLYVVSYTIYLAYTQFLTPVQWLMTWLGIPLLSDDSAPRLPGWFLHIFSAIFWAMSLYHVTYLATYHWRMDQREEVK